MYWSVYGDDIRQLYCAFNWNMAYYSAGNVVNSTNTSDDTNITDDLTVIPLEKDSFGECLPLTILPHWK